MLAYGSFEEAVDDIDGEYAQNVVIRYLKAVWRPTGVQERREDLPVRVWTLEDVDVEGGFARLQSLAGTEHTVQLPGTDKVTALDVVHAIRETLPGTQPCLERIVAIDGSLVQDRQDLGRVKREDG